MNFEDKHFEFQVSGPLAMFADPVCSNSGELMSYPVPPYSAVKGICDAIYWKPTIQWRVDRLRVVNPIAYESKGMLFPRSSFVLMDRENPEEGGQDRSMATYLRDVTYQIEAHMVWNEARPDMLLDRDAEKHWEIAERAIRSGGRRAVSLGKKDGMCTLADVKPCHFGEGEGAYDFVPEASFGTMVHSIAYASRETRLFQCVMRKGVITYPAPEECTMIRFVPKSEDAVKGGKR